MKPNLPKIYTRRGDQGLTTLGNNQRVTKDHLRVEICGTLDELNSFIGLLLTYPLVPIIAQTLSTVQRDLLNLGSELSKAISSDKITAHQTSSLEKTIDILNEPLPPLKVFILPGGSREAALCHVTRTVCRRAERQLVTLNRSEPVNPENLIYLNRLSDLLFVMARYLLAIKTETI